MILLTLILGCAICALVPVYIVASHRFDELED